MRKSPPQSTPKDADRAVALTPQQRQWRKQGYEASDREWIETRGPDGQVTEESRGAETPAQLAPISPDDFYQKAKGGRVTERAWQRALTDHSQRRDGTVAPRNGRTKPNW